jgi:hypothetical protein
MRAYMAYPIRFMELSGGLWIAGMGVCCLWVVPRLIARAAVAGRVRRFVPVGLATLMTILAAYAYFFRAEGGRLALGDAMAFRTFGWYITDPVLGIAVLAFAWFTAQRFWKSPAFFVTLAIFSLFFFYKTRIVHEHFWAARRLLPVIMPGALLLVPALVWELTGPHRLARWLGQGWRTTALSVLLLVGASAPIAAAFWRAASPVRPHVEYAGLIPRLEALSERFGDRDLVIVEGRDAASDLHVLAMPLAYIYARNVLVLNSAVPSRREFEGFITWARTRYERVWFLGGGGTDLLTANVTARPIASEQFQVPEYASLFNEYPRSSRQKEFDYGIYELIAASPPAAGPVRLDIGTNDDVQVVRFHAKERRHETGMVFRWSRGLSYILLQGIAPNATELTIRMSSGGRPAQAPAPEVSLRLADVPIGQAQPVDEVKPYTFQLPPGLAAAIGGHADPVRLELRVPTWSPAAFVGGTDTRDLGVIVTGVDVR